VPELIKDLKTAEQISRMLVEYAKKNDSKDNISVLVLKLN
jgi:hypothetical protein